mmetsp:Transcript_47763/g.76054  ORF Transcript_47763/g.76054 Transcript_47763/m.76054 type:complete len:109 (-) Transcript_47763:719-1045(-)
MVSPVASAAVNEASTSLPPIHAKTNRRTKHNNIKLSSTRDGSHCVPTFKPMSRPKVAPMFETEIIRCGSKLLHSALLPQRPSAMKGDVHSKKTQAQQQQKATTALQSN